MSHMEHKRMDDQPESHIPYAGGIVHGSQGVIRCTCGGIGYLIPPKQGDMAESYDERESNP